MIAHKKKNFDDDGYPKKHRFAWSSLPVRKKLFLLAFTMAFVPVVIITVYSVYTQSTTMRDRSIDDTKSSIRWLQNKLGDVVSSYTRTFYEFETDSTFKDAVVSWGKDPSQLTFDEKEVMINKLNGQLSINPDVSSISIFGLSNSEKLTVVASSARFETTTIDPTTMFGRSEGLQTNIYFLDAGGGPIMAHEMFSQNGQLSSYVTISMRDGFFTSILKEVRLGDMDGVILLNDANVPFSSVADESYSSFVGKATELAETNKLSSIQDGTGIDGYFWFFRSVGNGKIQIAETISDTAIKKAQANTIIVSLTMGVVIIIMCGLLSAFSSRMISHPILELSRAMVNTDLTNHPEVKETSHDEVGVLQHNYNLMSKKISELVDKEYKSQIATRDAELHAMQSQINPHFVYNTLQLIGGMAIQKGEKNIYDITTSFSDILRYSLDFERDTVPLSEEIRYLEAYIGIQNKRFSGKIAFKNNVPKEDGSFLVPKLILQPLLENSFKHGLSEKEGEWDIELESKEDNGDLLLTLVDNGVGMSEEKLSAIRDELQNDPERSLKSGEHIGLANVNLRLRLKYGGSPYGVSLSSVSGKGTSVTIRLRIERQSNENS